MKKEMYYDCEFLEGTQTIYQYGIKTDNILRFFGILLCIHCLMSFLVVGDNLIGILCIVPALVLYNLSMEPTPPTIDLISIGIVSGDDDREYYAISKDFNLKEAWNRYDEKVEIMSGDMRNRFPEGRKYKEYWIRENVLRPIFEEFYPINLGNLHHYPDFNYKNMKGVIDSIGKSNKQIAEEIKDFVYKGYDWNYPNKENEINLYGYYSAYDHVALCWLFGKMIDLPKGFPKFTIDLKQMLDEKVNKLAWELNKNISNSYTKLVNVVVGERGHDKDRLATFEEKLNKIKSLDEYPKETNSHNALADAIFCKNLHKFIKSI